MITFKGLQVTLGDLGAILIGGNRINLRSLDGRSLPVADAARACLESGSVDEAAEYLGACLANSRQAYGPGEEFAADCARYGAAMAALADFDD